MFRQRRAEPAGPRRADRVPGKTVATTWALAFAGLEQAAPRAVGLLRLLAFCAPEAIPLRLLLQPRPGLAGQLAPEVAPVLVPLLEDRAGGGGRGRGAAPVFAGHARPGTGRCRCTGWSRPSPLDQMPAELASQWRAGRRGPDRGRDPRRPATARDLAGVRGAAAARPGCPWPDSDGMGQIAHYLGYSGSYLAARDLFQLIAEAYGRMTPRR